MAAAATMVFNRPSDDFLFTITEARGKIDHRLRLRSANSAAAIDICNNGGVDVSGTFTVNGQAVASGDTVVLRTTNQDISGIKTFNHDVNIGSHDGTNGLKLAGTLVTSSATQLNYVDVTPGTAEASKALVLDSNKDIENIRTALDAGVNQYRKLKLGIQCGNGKNCRTDENITSYAAMIGDERTIFNNNFYLI